MSGPVLCGVGREWGWEDGSFKHPCAAVYEVGEGRDQVFGREDFEGAIGREEEGRERGGKERNVKGRKWRRNGGTGKGVEEESV